MMAAPNFDLHGALRESAGEPVLTNREALLDAIVQGIASGGTDVADAPELPPALQAVPSAPSRIARRVIGAGVIGWSVLALGSAAAATGLWYSLSVANPPAPPVMPSPAITSLAPDQEATSASLPSTPDTPAEPVTPALPAIVEAEPASSTAAQPPAGSPGKTGSDASTSAPVVETAPDAPNNHPEPKLTPQREDVAAEALDTVSTVVTDTVAPVISSVNISAITGDLKNLLTCALTIPVSVDVTDDSGVASVTARLTSPALTATSIDLADDGDGSWSGNLTTNVVGSLLAKVLDTQVSVEATDAHGNTTSRSVAVDASLLTCN